ncbi:chromosome segregation protein SMC [Arcticibacter eurypsychrophilus]|uniref:chromosome segregation protein SMC n=1 Tax=Arcticibacter eurypsychrophilus TaxID=1434752 RepID=UPI00084D5470|nr:chromosome segregation protein SMC [Arcticibacter eurypsychrophilus]
MQLTRLEVKGFKSFGDKITINFNAGITGIAGPNGCGKSNIVDAIRWVLGEQSTKMLRSEKMENIIFNGSKTRKPSQMAEVSLSFDNTKNILPTEFSQVTITRKLYRSGESEYRLNNVHCRLKDITDLFLDTGIGTDSYSIIELRMIEEIIANKEGSRRSLFEEASGISKYKLRKKQTFNKLKETELDLSRVEDLLFELEKNLKTLENQAKKAERYYRLKDQYKNSSIQLASFRISGFRKALDTLSEKEKAQKQNQQNILAEIEQLENDLKQLKQDQLIKEHNLSSQQKASTAFAAQIKTYESDKRIKNEQIRFLQDKEKRLTEELEKDKNQLNHVIYTIKRLQEEHLQESENLRLIRSGLAEIKEEQDETIQQQLSYKAQLDACIKQNSEMQNLVYQAEKDLGILDIQKESLLQESRRHVADTTSRETELDTFNINIQDLDTKIVSEIKEFNAIQQFETDLEGQIKLTEEQIFKTKEQLVVDSRKLDSRQNEYNLTKSLVDNLEGFPESIRFLKKNTSWTKQAPLLSDVLFCKEEYRVAIENYLEPVMNHYVVDTQAEAVKAIQLLSNTSKGRANFFIIDALESLPEQPMMEVSEPDRIPALSIIDADPKYSRLCRQLLRNVFILTSGDEEEISQHLPDKNLVFLSRTGQFSRSRVTMSGGSIGLFEGKRIGRARNLDKLDKSIRTLQTQTDILKASLEQEEKRHEILKSSSKKTFARQIDQDMIRLNNERLTLHTRREQYITFIESSQSRKQDIEQKIISITDKREIAQPALFRLRDSKHDMNLQLMKRQQEYLEITGLLSEKLSRYNQENIRFHQQQNKVSGLLKDLDYREVQEQTFQSKITQNSKELIQINQEITSILQAADHSDEDLIQMYIQKEEFEKGVQESEKIYLQSRDLITELEAKLTQIRKNKDQIDQVSTTLNTQKNDLKLELNALKERLSIEFSVDIADLLDTETPEREDEEKLKERTHQLKKQLDEFGGINSMAMEAFQEMTKRYSFIQSEKKDLAEARATLMATIREIDESAKSKFMESFSKVRENFIEVFRSLFNEEDSCDLILTQPENPLESDIDIIARPKGKRPLSINQLSGGEKTLTATALLFSLYLLKPAPFCIFDEVDAPLDDSNIDKFNSIIKKFSSDSQFIVVSHNKRTIANTDVVYGVTMVEQGVSIVVAVDLREVA